MMHLSVVSQEAFELLLPPSKQQHLQRRGPAAAGDVFSAAVQHPVCGLLPALRAAALCFALPRQQGALQHGAGR